MSETANSSEWLVGTATADITPSESMRMAGYGAREEPSEGTLQPLHAKAIALEDDRGTNFVAVGAEVLAISRPLHAEVTAACEERYDLPPANLLLNASHTHCGPVYRERKTEVYSLNDEERTQAREYRSFLVETLVDIVGEALERELRNRHADGRELPTLCYTILTFQNPTGTTLPIERRQRLLELVAEYDFLVLEDDAYGDLRYDGEDVPSLAALDETGRVVYVGTFSKTIAPGVRIGWAVADEEIATRLDRLNVGAPNMFSQSVVSRYCTERFLEAAVPELRRAYERRRDHMLVRLGEYMPSAVRWTEPDGGFFVWVKLPEGFDTESMLPAAAEAGVIYMPRPTFFPETGGDRFLRLSFSGASLAEIDRGIDALARTVRANAPDASGLES